MLIKWVDSSYTQPGWQDRETLEDWAKDKDTECYTAGLVIHEDKRHIALALSMNEHQFADVFKIPKRQIVSIQELGKVDA